MTYDLKLHWEKTLKVWHESHPEKRSELSKRQMSDPKRIERQREIGRMVFKRKEWQAKALINRKNHPALAPGPKHHTAKLWRLADPTGVIWEFRNLRHFLRTHPELFEPEDVVWVKRGKDFRCRAQALANLHPDRTKPFKQWKGWVWILEDELSDPLKRNVL